MTFDDLSPEPHRPVHGAAASARSTPAPATAALARALTSTSWDLMPPSLRTHALDLITDSVAVIGGGAVNPAMVSLRGAITSSDGPSTVIGPGYAAATRDAVLLNAATITVLQRQDGYSAAIGHPASQLFAALFAIAEQRAIGSRDFLEAFVGGYEVAARVGVSLGGVPPHLHDIGNWVTIGVSAAAASLLSGRDVTCITAAIEGAASLALAFDRYTTAAGATMHHLYPAMAAIEALTIGEAAAAGLSSLPGSLERYYGRHFGRRFDPTALVDGVDTMGWSRYMIGEGYIKLHPSCAHLHGVNDAVAMLIAEERVREKDVEHVDVAVFDDAMRIESSDPHNELAARFSARATVASALRYGHLDDAGLLDSDALASLMRRIEVRHDPSLDRHKPAGRPGRVTVTLKDGRTVSRTVIHPRGTPQVPATRSERSEKARTLLARPYGEARTKEIIAAIQELPSSDSLHDLTATLRIT
ncbi:2-methylcitrate dehydratase PrpD [Nonomuraea thailandensis]|uniref:2-methylcitrate dehydratase PrpD n=1 Tax=Nonomuraea thailandensis TaxID=1188745 RepID=A0A9X2JY94_9ACTN|nr:MmgE/PrpD family protein [Nonomuraea thailandensis]MCP2353558.1 2-methylcitrate dehydratase PrpD [Nonomuraea thailandensis]